MKGISWVMLMGLMGCCIPSFAAEDTIRLGDTYGIAERDLLDVIRERTETAWRGDAGRRFRQVSQETTTAYVKRPVDLALLKATTPRRWTVDLSIVTEQAIMDDKGREIVAKGTRVNPLEVVTLSKPMIFLDADDADQVHWAQRLCDKGLPKPVVVIVAGDRLELQARLQQPVYADQAGKLVKRFNIQAVPARASQLGHVLQLEELAI